MSLPPEKLGDRGQRYVVQAIGYPMNVEGWQDVAYTNDYESARRASAAILLVPSVKEVFIKDRNLNA